MMGSRDVLVWSALLGILTIPTAIYFLRRPSLDVSKTASAKSDNERDDALLTEFSSHHSHTTAFATYPHIRQFYRPHVHREKLPEIANLPLLVFIHGLGGSIQQFCPLLSSLINIAPCFALDLPGHGASNFQPTDYRSYKIEAFVALWQTAIQDICKQYGHSQVVFIGHSMGGSLAAMLATNTDFHLAVAGIIAICPKGSPPPRSQTTQARRFLSLPDAVLDTFRWFDRRGAEDSTSVRRFVGPGATAEDKRRQLRFNESFVTPVWKRSTIGLLPHYDAAGQAHGGFPGRETWSKLRTPIFLVGGEADKITKPDEVTDIVSYLQKKPRSDMTASEDSQMPPLSDTVADDGTEKASGPPSALPSLTECRLSHSNLILKTAILPSPAAHALLYTHSTCHLLAGLIEDFLATHVHLHLSQTWQLQHLTTVGKWEVKNLEKWKRTLSVSGPIPSVSSIAKETNIFRALKTLREQDDEHTPVVFLERWKDKIAAVVDISHDTPIYDTKKLEKGGISYHKCPSVSKVPPSPREAADFIALIDRLRGDMEGNEIDSDPTKRKAIGVHCHYGYNRTGYLICSYLIERCKMDVEEALEDFRKAKPPGIKHEHFVDALYVRHVKGLRKGRTWKLEN